MAEGIVVDKFTGKMWNDQSFSPFFLLFLPKRLFLLHSDLYFLSLPAVNGGLEAGAVDDGFGYGKSVDVNVYVVLFLSGGGAFVHLVRHVLRVVPP